MSETIWKFPLQVADFQEVQMPKGAAVLCVQTQGETPCLWAQVDPSAETIRRAFKMYGTGHKIKEDGFEHYVGTFQIRSGTLVFHVFTDRAEVSL